MLRFKRNWWAALDHGFTPHGFCDDETYSQLPAVPEQLFTDDFHWLDAETAGSDAYYMEPNPVPPPVWQLVNRRLSRSGVALPVSFITFMSSAQLQASIPSCTSNGWELSAPSPSPVERYGFSLRFMHDQQGCWYFYLYLAEDGSCPVIGSEELFTPETDEDLTFTAREFMEAAKWLAPNFEEFIYRYWVENVIWHQTIYKERPASVLPTLAQDYVRLLKTPDRPSLDRQPAPLSPCDDHSAQPTLW